MQYMNCSADKIVDFKSAQPAEDEACNFLDKF